MADRADDSLVWWRVALALLILGIVIGTWRWDAARSCTTQGKVVDHELERFEACRSPSLADPPVVAAGVLVVMLLWPAFNEVTLPGGGGIKRREKGERTRTATLTEAGAHGRTAGDQIATARVLATRELLDALFDPGDGPLVDVDFRLYTWDEELELLVPAFDESGAAAIRWPSGIGATGAAWRSEHYVVARGEEVSNAVFGLSEEQQAHFADLQVVAAMPVRNASGRVIAVLTGSSSNADSQLTSPEGVEEHLVAAELSARALVDLLKWFDDK